LRRKKHESRADKLAFWISFAAVALLDQLTKWYVRSHFAVGESMQIIGSWVQLVYRENPGAAFGMLAGARWLFMGISAVSVALTMCLYPRLSSYGPSSRFMVPALGLVAGGALGNLIDRARQATVTDFIHVKHFPAVFNIADSAIVTGSIILGIVLIIHTYRSG
jgi:signal peptidase II